MNIKTCYFSPTGTTKKIISGIAIQLAAQLGCSITDAVDITPPGMRKNPLSFSRDDLVVFGLPVYAGRVPNVLLKYLNTVMGNDAMSIAVVVYGNRNYDDALIELTDILDANGFRTVACGAFIGEHSFSRILGQGRPDEQDMSAAAEFARQAAQKIRAAGEYKPVAVPGNRPPKPYFQPKNQDGNPVSILKVKPKTSSACIRCGLCAKLCPIGSIDADNVSELNGFCIKCCACVKNCPVQAKFFDDPNYLWHKHDLESLYTSHRRIPEFYL